MRQFLLRAALTVILAALLCGCALSAETHPPVQDSVVPEEAISVSRPNIPPDITPGTETLRGFVQDNVYHSPLGDIHYSSYYPESFDRHEVYGLFITLPGWEGLYFQGIGANMEEDFGTEAVHWDGQMIILSLQLNDWGETSARETIALTEYFLDHYRIDPKRVYLHGYSGGGETASIVLGLRPELYTAALLTSTEWEGDLRTLTEARTPVYLAIGEGDSYYGSASLKNAYETLRNIYEKQGLSQQEIDGLLVLNVQEQSYFTARGYQDQHGGGLAFAHDKDVMGWLFGIHEQGGTTNG